MSYGLSSGDSGRPRGGPRVLCSRGGRKLRMPRPFVNCCVMPAVAAPDPDEFPRLMLSSHSLRCRCSLISGSGKGVGRDMRWIRSNVRLGAWCALFALAVQLVLSFDHVHLNGGSSTSVALALSTRLTALAPSATSEAPAVPSDQDSDGQAGRFCDICALIQLAGSVAPAAPPVLTLPVTFGAVAFDRSSDSEITASSPLFFQPRAPPLV
jgi:DUF2946 family protein